MDRNDLKSFFTLLLKQERADHLSLVVKKKYPDIYSETINSTNYLSKDSKFTERIYNVLNDLTITQICQHCGNPVRFKDLTDGYSKFCGMKCVNRNEETQKKKGQTKFKHYGDPNFNNMEKNKQTKLKRYGNENYRNEEKIFNTKLELYDNRSFSNPDKMKETKQLRYGNSAYVNPEKAQRTLQEHPEIGKLRAKRVKQTLADNPEITEQRVKKLKETLWRSEFEKILNSPRIKNRVVPKFNPEDYLGNKARIQGKVEIKKYLWTCVLCGRDFHSGIYNGRIPVCRKCFPPLKGTSHLENQLQDWLETYIPIERNKHFGRDYSLDVFIPSKNIGIEFNGNYWHSELNGKKDSRWHLKKTQYFEKKGIQILHVFEDEWIQKQTIVQSIILAKIGLFQDKFFARNCTNKTVSTQDATQFLFNNHIQGEIKAHTHLGLYHKDELIALMSFGKPRYDKSYKWELLRFCTKINTNIVGGASKILAHFKQTHSGSILSYADLRFSTGGLYKILGFELLRQSDPNYYYLDKKGHYSRRIQFQKHKLKAKLKIFDPNLTEWQNMQLNGYDRIWDCGNLVFGLN